MEVDSNAGRRLDAVLATLAFKNLKEVADKIGVVRPHLAAARNAGTRIGSKLATGMENVYGIRRKWLLEGEGPVFLLDRSPGKDVSNAILTHLRHGTPRTSGVPLFEDSASVTTQRGEVPVRTTQGEPHKWKTYASRAVRPAISTCEKGFFLFLADRRTARILGARVGDYALLVGARTFFGRSRPRTGDRLVCLVDNAGEKQLCRVSVRRVVTEEGSDWRVVGSSWGGPSGDEMFLESRRGVPFVRAARKRFELELEAETDPGKRTKIVGVGLRLERDLVAHGADESDE